MHMSQPIQMASDHNIMITHTSGHKHTHKTRKHTQIHYYVFLSQVKNINVKTEERKKNHENLNWTTQRQKCVTTKTSLLSKYVDLE